MRPGIWSFETLNIMRTWQWQGQFPKKVLSYTLEHSAWNIQNINPSKVESIKHPDCCICHISTLFHGTLWISKWTPKTHGWFLKSHEGQSSKHPQQTRDVFINVFYLDLIEMYVHPCTSVRSHYQEHSKWEWKSGIPHVYIRSVHHRQVLGHETNASYNISVMP